MKNRPVIAGAAGALLGHVVAGNAEFVGVSVELTDSSDGLETYRLYADFDDPKDTLDAVGGIPGVGELEFWSVAPLFNDGGPFTGLKTEDFPAGSFAGPRDSWVTIGDDLGFPSPTDYSPGFGGIDAPTNVIKGTHFSDTNAVWFCSPCGDSGVAGAHTLFAQFTFPAGTYWLLQGAISYNQAERHAAFEIAIDPESVCPPDLDRDQQVGFADLLTVLASWGTCDCPADLDGSGLVGRRDLQFLFAAWGDCP